MRLFFSAGEASGDAYAAEILEAIRLQAPNALLEIQAIGGHKLKESGVPIVADSSTWGSIGFVAVSRVFFSGFAGSRRAKRVLTDGEPGLFIAIDCGLLNIRLSRFAKKHGWKVLYFSPPGSWKRDRQGADLPAIADEIVTPFEWSATILNQMGASAHWFGHPIKEMIANKGDLAADRPRETIAVLPGSRHAELKALLPVLAATLRNEARICDFAVAPTFSVAEVEAEWRALCPNRNDRFFRGDAYGVLSRARAGVICSGTATLEAALCACPMVVIYRVHVISHIELFILGLNPKRISQPNILLDQDLVPELVQKDASPDRIRHELHALLDGGEKREAQLKAFKEIDSMLGGSDTITKTASLALDMLGTTNLEGRAGVVADQTDDLPDHTSVL